MPGRQSEGARRPVVVLVLLVALLLSWFGMSAMHVLASAEVAGPMPGMTGAAAVFTVHRGPAHELVTAAAPAPAAETSIPTGCCTGSTHEALLPASSRGVVDVAVRSALDVPQTGALLQAGARSGLYDRPLRHAFTLEDLSISRT